MLGSRRPVSAFVAGSVLLLGVFGCEKGQNANAPSNDEIVSVTLSPSSAQIEVGETVNLTATVEDHGGSTRSVDLDWSASGNAVGVDPQFGTALVTGIDAGSSTVTATYHEPGSKPSDAGIRGNAAVTVLPSTATVSISPASAQITAGDNADFTCTVTKKGQTLPNEDLTWSSSNPGVAAVSDKGVVVGVNPGSAQIECRDMMLLVQGIANVTVTAPSVSVDVVPAAVTLEMGQTTTLGLTPAWSATFTSGNPSVATVDANGTISGVSPGTTAVTVSPSSGSAPSAVAKVGAVKRTHAARFASGPVTVPVTIKSATTPKITTAPNPAFVPVGGTVQLTYTAAGGVGTPTAQLWSSHDVSITDAASGVGTKTPTFKGISAGATVVGLGVVFLQSDGGLIGYPAPTTVDVQGQPETCAASGTYSVTPNVEFDAGGSSSFINLASPLALTITVSGGSIAITAPAALAGTGTINNNCDVSITTTGSVHGIPNVKSVILGRVGAGAGNIRLVYAAGVNGALPQNYPVYYTIKN